MDNTGTAKVLPAVRVPVIPVSGGTNGNGLEEAPLVELPSSGKFGFAWPEQSPTSAGPSAPPVPTLSSLTNDQDSSEIETSEPESMVPRDSYVPPAGTAQERYSASNYVDNTPPGESPSSNNILIPSSSPPRLSRAFSMPLPSQLGHLKNPHRTSPGESPYPLLSSYALSHIPNTSRFHELSLELADSVQMVIQTLLQVSPPHLLDPAKEQFAACSLSVPSPSISALLTTMKNLNYVSANVSSLTTDASYPLNLRHSSDGPVLDDFDVGEMLQSVGDALSGLAAQAGVDLVLYHADVGMKHVSVKGDECGMSYALTHIIRQVLDTASAGDTLEIGLFVSPAEMRRKERQDSLDPSDTENGSRCPSRASSTASNLPESDGPLRVTFDIAHKFAAPENYVASGSNSSNQMVPYRAKPRLDGLFLRRLLRIIGSSLREDLQPRLFDLGRSCELSLVVEIGSPEAIIAKPNTREEEAIRQPYANANIQLATEPSLEELMQFAETLRGKKVALYATVEGSFAHHLTSYLTAWGLDVSHITLPLNASSMSPEVNMEIPEEIPTSEASSPSTVMDSPKPMLPSDVSPLEISLRENAAVAGKPSIILIDDDVDALRKRLVQMRTEAPFNMNLSINRQRPKLSSMHRTKSSPHVYRQKPAKNPSSVSQQQVSVPPVLIHFTSLSNFKLVKDLVHSIFASPGPSGMIPEVIVLPKPAGPRRVLTALRTAIIKPIVDPFFTPIATSPISPSGHGLGPLSPFFRSGPGSPSQKISRPPISPRSGSDRTVRTTKDGVDLVQRLPPSPLRESDSMEYFSEAAMKLGTSPSSGLVIQSPDGQPAGIFFHPRGTMSRLQRQGGGQTVLGGVINPPGLIRDTGNLKPPGEPRRLSGRVSDRISEASETESASDEKEKLSKTFSKPIDRSGFAAAATGLADPVPFGRKSRQSLSPRAEELRPSRSNSSTSPNPSPMANVVTLSPVEGPGPVSSVSAPSHAASPEVKGSPPNTPTERRPSGPPSPNAAKRTLHRRSTHEGGSTSSSKKGKGPESDIVPPVKVLIVEDNPINQTILSTFMRKKRIKYDVAQNGAEAVAKWRSGGFHLILMDIQMPVMDGIEATKEIRRLERLNTLSGTLVSTPPSDGQQTPSETASSDSRSSTGGQTPYKSSVIIVALTASALQSDRVAALAAGCNDFLTKPVSLLWLNNKIIEWGSIKALQMWADLRPEVVKNIATGQMTQARSVASRLHVPEHRREPGRSSSAPKLPLASTFSATETKEPGKGNADQEEVLKVGMPLERRAGSDIIVNTLSFAESSKKLAYPSGATSSGLSGQSIVSVPAVTPISDKAHEKDSSRSRPGSSRVREVSGEEALIAHIQGSAREPSVIEEVQPILLGERSISTESRSIAQVMHTPSPTPGMSGSSATLGEEMADSRTDLTVNGVNGHLSPSSETSGSS